jgi:hypothetical protein
VDLIRRFHDFAPETRSLLLTHAHEILKTQDDNIVKKYITYVYKSFNIGAPDINEEMKRDLKHFGKNIANFYNRLHLTSPICYPFLNCNSESIPHATFARLTGISRQTLYNASLHKDSSILNMPTNINRSGPTAYSTLDTDRVHDWIENICPVPSGSRYPKHYQYMTTKDLYRKYIEMCQDDPKLPRMSKESFIRVHKTVNIFAQVIISAVVVLIVTIILKVYK